MTSLHRCVEEITDPNITVKEKGRKANFLNPERAAFRKVRVDGCLVVEGKRADWIVTKVGVASAIVELKGKDLAHAVEQLFATVSNRDCLQWLEQRKILVILCTRVSSGDTSVQKTQEKARKLGMRLFVFQNQRDLVMENLIASTP